MSDLPKEITEFMEKTIESRNFQERREREIIDGLTARCGKDISFAFTSCMDIHWALVQSIAVMKRTMPKFLVTFLANELDQIAEKTYFVLLYQATVITYGHETEESMKLKFEELVVLLSKTRTEVIQLLMKEEREFPSAKDLDNPSGDIN